MPDSLRDLAPGVNIKDLNTSVADYVTYREDSRAFADVTIWSGQPATVTEFAAPERVDGFSATFRLLPMLGVHPPKVSPMDPLTYSIVGVGILAAAAAASYLPARRVTRVDPSEALQAE